MIMRDKGILMSEQAATEWYYARNNRQEGPVEVDVVRGMLASGELRPTDLVWTSGMPDWKEAGAVAELVPPTRVEVKPVPPQGQQAGPGVPPPSWGPTHAPAGGYGPIGYAPPMHAGSQQGMALAALVCSLFGLVCCPFIIGAIPAVVGLVLSINALSAMRRTGNHEGEGLAKVAMIISAIDLALAAAALGVRLA
jgi:hypothetical protein